MLQSRVIRSYVVYNASEYYAYNIDEDVNVSV